MTSDQLKKAISNAQLPLNFGDIILLLFVCVLALGLIVTGLKFYFQSGGSPKGCCFLLAALPIIYVFIYRTINDKSLVCLSDNLPSYKKVDILDALSRDPDVKSINQKSDYSYTLHVEDKWSNEPFTVLILFNKSDYAVNALKGILGSARFSIDKSNEIIAKIKALEFK